MKRSPIVGIDALSEPQAFSCLIDVRSPAEFADDHVPGAINCPVLDDAERARVGTIYKQISPFEARKVGAALVSRNIAQHIETYFQGHAKQWRPLVYCWRGGQRSGAMVTVLRQIGWDAQQLDGGYKAYRRQVLDQLDVLPARLQFNVITGATGSAKTRILQSIARQGGQILDLEELASHKGSVLGRLPDTPQPSQKSFDSTLWQQLAKLDAGQPVFVEAESRKIGRLEVPAALIERMRQSPCISIEAPREARVNFLLTDYDYFTRNIEVLLQHLDALRPLRGNARVDAWGDAARAGNWPQFVDALLTEHYDPLYLASQERNYQIDRDSQISLHAEQLESADIEQIARQSLVAAQQNSV